MFALVITDDTFAIPNYGLLPYRGRCQIRIGKMQCNPCYQSNLSSQLIRIIFQFDNALLPYRETVAFTCFSENLERYSYDYSNYNIGVSPHW